MAKKAKSRMPVESLGSSVPTASDKARQRRYEIEDGLRTMQRAEEIKKDKSLVKDIKLLAKEQMASLSKVGAK
jgi:hypothetical protein